MFPLNFYDLIGLTGTALFVIAYGGVQVGRLDARGAPALLMNLVGAILVLLSLTHTFNLAAFVLETIWGLLALYGLIRLAARRRRP